MEGNDISREYKTGNSHSKVYKQINKLQESSYILTAINGR